MAKPVTPGNSIRRGMITGLMIPLTYAKNYPQTGDSWNSVLKPN